MKDTKVNTVYKIVINGKTRYIGRTNNILRRTKEHNRGLKNGSKKLFYDFLRATSFYGELVLEPIFTGSKTECKRFECLEILKDYFGVRELMQNVPNISDRIR